MEKSGEKNMKKITLFLTSCVLLLLLLTGCSKNNNVAETSSNDDKPVTMTKILDSKKPVIMYDINNHSRKDTFGPNSQLWGIIVFQNGKGTYYNLDNSPYSFIKDVDKLTEDQVIEFAKTGDRKFFNTGKKYAIHQYKNATDTSSRKTKQRLEDLKYVAPKPAKVKISGERSDTSDDLIGEGFDLPTSKDLSGFMEQMDKIEATSNTHTGFYEPVNGLVGNKYNYGGFWGNRDELVMRYDKKLKVKFAMDSKNSKYLDVHSDWD